jgi:hypothetical protein
MVDAPVDAPSDAALDAPRDSLAPPTDTGPVGRVPGAIALYTFDEGAGTTVHDVSGVGAALDLTIEASGTTHWIAGGLSIDAESLLDTSTGAAKIVAACSTSGEVTLEAWVVPANTTQGASSPARIAGITLDTGTLDTSLSVYQGAYLNRIRTSTSSEANNDLFGAAAATTSLTHVVLTRAKDGMRKTWVNGVLDVQVVTGGDLSTWDPTFRIAVADEHAGGRAWLGELHLVAFYDRALNDAEIAQNRAAGP